LLNNYTNPYNYTTSGIIEFSANDKLIAQRMELVIGGFPYYGIVFVNIENGDIIKEFPASEEEILNMKFTKDGKYFVFPSNNFTQNKFCVKTYKLDDFSLKSEITTGYTQQIWDLNVSPDSKMIGTTGDDGVFVWNIETSENIIYAQPPDLIWAVGFSADSKFVLIGSESGGGSTTVIDIQQMLPVYDYQIRGFLNIQDAANTNLLLLNSGSQIAVLRKKFGASKDAPMLTANVGNSLIFSDIELNKEQIKTIKFANYSTDTLLVSNADLAEYDNDIFEILDPPPFPLYVFPNSEFELNIKCLISYPGEFSANIHISSDAFNTKEFGIYEVFVSAKAPGTNGAIISNDINDQLVLGGTPVNVKLTKPITIKNIGNEDLIISNIGLIQDFDYFSIEQTFNFPLTVHSNDSLVLDISFLCDSSDYGYFGDGKIYFISNAVNTDSMVIILSAFTTQSSVENINSPEDKQFNLVVYPNPILDKGTIEFNLTTNLPENISLSLIDINGKKIKDLYNEYTLPGKRTIELQRNNLPTGTYFIMVINRNFSKLYPIIIN